MLKYFYYILLAMILVFMQQSVLPAAGFLANLNLLLVAIIFITIISGLNIGLIFGVFIGLLLNFYSFLPFGTFIVVYLLVVAMIDFLYKNVLINFSFYTNLILIIVATVLNKALIIIFSYSLFALGLVNTYISINKVLGQNFLGEIFLNLVLMSLIFILAKLTIKKLNLVFILKK